MTNIYRWLQLLLLRENFQFQEETSLIAVSKVDVENSVLQLQNNRLREKIKKQSRTHALLVSIVVAFALSWFPLNVLNIVLDIHNIFEVLNSRQSSLGKTTYDHIIEKFVLVELSNATIWGLFARPKVS